MKRYFILIVLLIFTNLLFCQDLEIKVSNKINTSGTLVDRGSDHLVIIIAGSGPTDRDCNNPAGLKTDAFKMIAESLANHNISSYRYDKRGIGKSSSIEESTVTLYDFINDASIIVDSLSKKYKTIILMGHSEGALIGSIVASENEHVDAFISISGISETLDKIVLDQLAKYPMLVPMAQIHIDEIKADQPLSEVNPMLMSLFRKSVVPFLKSTFEIDPIVAFAKIDKPILTIGGSCDAQVSDNHAKTLHESNSNSQLLVIKNMGHTMKKLETDCSDNMESYSNPEMGLHDELVNAIVEFVKN